MNIPDNKHYQQLSMHDTGKQKQEGARQHPAVYIYLWMCLAVAVPLLQTNILILLVCILSVMAIKVGSIQFYILLRRTRWILLSVLAIYAYTSPGAALWPQLGLFSPITEGLEDGLMQLLRLLTILASVSILLSFLSQAQLIAGIYVLSRPLTFVGLSTERIAVRLGLTLQYAENAMQETAKNWRDSLESLLTPLPVNPSVIELSVNKLSRRDWLLIATASTVLLSLCLYEGVWL